MNNKRVAILGLSFRLPGSTRESFWPSLTAGRNLVSTVAADRWTQDAYFHPRKSHAGTSYTFAAGSIGDVSAFDAGFFGISPREAAQMDPQQRLLLELSWEALENAGVRPSRLRGTPCGVFVGASTVDYSFRFSDDLAAIDSGVATGTSSSITANRISYALDLRGPSLVVDTACSSSLVAFHLACRSIASGESTHALAGGVSLHMHPYGFVTFSKASMLSRRGVCSVFDAAGDGYVRSEGGGMLLLKDYERALSDGDPILAVVAASAVNSDGRKPGLTVPSAQAQSELLRQAYAAAGITPEDVDYVEAHGTGTAVGDPVETQALGDALGMQRASGSPLLIGSVKSNLGHLEAAAGVAGLVKALHCIEHRSVPPTIHFHDPNPNIRFDEWNLRVVTENMPLKPAGRIVVGVNSFGFGGANAHVVLESNEQPVNPERRPRLVMPLPVVVSGRSVAALRASARDLALYLRDHQEAVFYDVAWSTVFHRDIHEHRAVLIADSVESLADALDDFANDVPIAGVVESGTAACASSGIAFVYTGNGSQWEGMGASLIAEEPLFRAAVQRVDEFFRPLGGYSLEDELEGKNGAERYRSTEIGQPALFALQVGVTEVLRARGVAPSVVVGHSVGEVAAAWASGALSLEQAVGVVYHRSRLQERTRGSGEMTAVALGEQAMSELLARLHLRDAVTIAAINDSRSVTVAGAVSALEALEAALGRQGATFKRLDLDYAFHSQAMDGIRPELIRSLAKLRPGAVQVPFASSVTGAMLGGPELDADYWWRNIREPVRFEEAIKGIQATGVTVFAEIGPQALLRGYIQTSLRDGNLAGTVIPTVTRAQSGVACLWSAVALVAVAGAAVDWHALFRERGRFVRLPNYPWQRERHWHALSAESYQRLQRRKEHPLLGYRLHESEWAWENRVDTQLCPTLAHHMIGETVVMPGAAYAEMALAAARLWQGREHVEIEQLGIRAPLILSATQTKTLRFVIEPADGSFTVRSRDHSTGQEWTLHATGRISMEAQDVVARQTPLTPPARAADTTGAEHEEITRAVGLNYGPAYRAIESVWVERGSACATFRVPVEVEAELDDFDLHPALLDCTFQLIIQLLKDDYIAQSGTIYVPASIDGLHIHSGAARPAFARANLLRAGPHSITASFTLYGPDGEAVAWMREARFNSIRLSKSASDRLSYLDYHCVPRPHPQLPTTAPARLFDHLQKKIADLVRKGERQDPLARYTGEIEPLLDTLCGRFAARALKSLSANGQVLTHDEVQACAMSCPESAPLLACLIGMLEEDKAVTATGNGWHFHGDDALPTPEGIWNTLISDYPDYLPVVHVVGRVGMHLADLLNGRRTLDQVMPRECTSSRLLRRLMADAGLPEFQHALQELAAQVIGQLPAGKRLRIVEVAAGDPLFAANICRALDFDTCDFVFATAAPATPEACLRLKENFPPVVVRQIALEDSGAAPPVQANEQFHLALVVADFVSERDAMLALAWAKRHLSAGGAILLVEQHPSRWIDFVFGARRTWWSDASGGSWISRHRRAGYWRQQLQKLGLEVGPVQDLAAGALSGPYLILAHNAHHHPATAVHPVAAPTRNWVLLSDPDGLSADLAGQLARTLEARGDRVVRVVPGTRMVASRPGHFQANLADASQIEALFRAIEADGRIDGIVHLYGLVAPREDSSPLLLLEKQVDRCASSAAVLRACESAETKAACWLVTARVGETWLAPHGRRQGAQVAQGMDAAFWGFGRSLMNESPASQVRLVDVDDRAALHTIAFTLAREMACPDAEQEIILTASGDRYVPRLRFESPLAFAGEPAPESSTHRLELQSAGQLRNLRWEAHPRARIGGDEVEVAVQATGLNFRDVMIALGLLSDEVVEGGFAGSTLGLEFAGVVTGAGARVKGFAPGERVLGFGPMSFANRVVTRASLLSAIPAGMSFEAAATIPSAFFTVHYALNHLARLEQGEKILIHGAAGGVGIAAIQMAKQCGAEIFATAGSDEKRDFLRLMGVRHVFDSRSYAFADEILEITGGRGVDVLLNSLAGEAIHRNLRVLRSFGRFLELGKRDFQENTRIGLRHFRNNISYFGVDVDQLMKERPELTEKLFRELMHLFGEGVFHPLPYRCFEAVNVVDGFRYMQQSRHIGKIVVTYRHGIRHAHGASADRPPFELPPDATYLVTGGLSGFGLKTAEWLAAKGACNLVLVSRRGVIEPDAREAISRMERDGVRVHATACDVTDAKALSSLLARIGVSMPPLRGIVHAAAVIDDGLARNLGRDRIRRVLAPKVLGAFNLHELTLDKPLDFFVLYSSATTLFGNPGQGNYVAANSALEAFAATRRAQGLPALCVRWGAIGDAGYLARNAQVKDALQGRMGGSALSSAVALDALEGLLLADRSGAAVLEFDWGALSRFLPTAGSPKFGEVATKPENASGGDDESTDMQRLAATLIPDELAAVIARMLRKEIGDILRIAPDKIRADTSLNDMGFDSLMKVELATAVEARFAVSVPVMALGDYDTVARLGARIMSLLAGGSKEEEAELADDHARQVAALHGDESLAETYARTAEELQSGELPAAARMIE